MEKKAYVKPSLESETFVPQTYIAACGDSGVTYLFECNAGTKLWGDRNYRYKVWTDSGQVLASERKGLYGPCGETHEADSDDEFLWGYMDNVNTPWNENIRVRIWRGPNNDNVHCTTKLNEHEWETGKS
ncbi:hypothetical protein [Bacteroides caecicola]|uniref:hypothetical protein n=1 Tax=Bacteroides caecicola TaxID=1462569 RepID=UPI002012D28B|nr:hypothetical protein [Bacteroides caecicola]MCL1624619.1 hypothetical protein [Bacteroides caecicola]